MYTLQANIYFHIVMLMLQAWIFQFVIIIKNENIKKTHGQAQFPTPVLGKLNAAKLLK